MSLRTALVATLAILLSPGAALASTFVVYAPGVDATTAAAKAQEELGDGDIRVAGPINDWIGVPDDQPVVVGVEATRCAPDERRSRPLKGYLVHVRSMMAEMSYSDALSSIDQVIEKLPCLAENAETEDIYTVFFLQGVARFFERDEAGAEESFAAAAAISPGREWPKDWPPTPEPVYLRALRRVSATPPAPLDAEIEGEILVNGQPDDGIPRLAAGGHLLWLPAFETGMWIEVPPLTELSRQEVLVTTAGQLRDGLLSGQERYAPWIEAVAAKEAWEDVVLVGPEGAMRYQGGVFTPLGATGRRLAARARRAARADKRLGPVGTAGLVTVGVGAGVAVAGLALNLSAYQAGLPEVGKILIPRTEYEGHVQRNKIGLGIAVGGGVTVAAGAILTLVGVSLPDGGVAVAPWVIADDRTVAFGISGRLP